MACKIAILRYPCLNPRPALHSPMTWTYYDEAGRQRTWQAVTPDGVARALAEQQAGRLRYCHDAGAWFVWDGALWRRDRTGAVLAMIREIARERGTDPGGLTARASGTAAFITGAERFARGEPALAVTAEAWNADPFLLGTPAGPVDLRTGAARPAEPGDGLDHATAVAPADAGAAAACPLWHRFLAESFGGDAALIGFVQRFCGYALTGSVAEHALLYGWGTGGNGKSVFLNTVLHLLGDYARPAALATLVSSDGARHGADVDALRRARLVGVAESDGGWNERRLKLLSGGDALAVPSAAPGGTGRGSPRMDRTTAKLLIMGNQPPAITGVDEAVRRRLRVVPFQHRPARPDRDLEAKLRDESPGILRWMVDGCLAWQADGLGAPSAVREATDDALDAQDLVAQFITERCLRFPPGSPRTVTAAALYAAWCRWAEAAGEPAGSQRALAMGLACHGFIRDRTQTTRLYRRLGLREDPAEGIAGRDA